MLQKKKAAHDIKNDGQLVVAKLETEIETKIELVKPETSVTKDTIRSIQKELNRVGCTTGRPDGLWGKGSRRALTQYGKHGKVKLASLDPSTALLDQLKSKQSRVCPLFCRSGFEEKNSSCVRIKRQTNINSPEFVFMFIGNEPAYLAAFNHDPNLFQDAYRKGIAIVTPNTLLSSLRIVSHLWSIDRQNSYTRELADQATKVYDKLRIFVGKMEKLGLQLNTVQKTYDDSWNTLKDGKGSLSKQVASHMARSSVIYKTSHCNCGVIG